MRPMMLLAACSLCFAACNDVPRPDANVCMVNVKLLQLKCRNLLRSYDSSGNILSGVPAEIRQYPDAATMLAALDKSVSIDTAAGSWAAIKAWINDLKGAN